MRVSLLALVGLLSTVVDAAIPASKKWVLQAYHPNAQKYATSHWILGELQLYSEATCSDTSNLMSKVNRSFYDCCSISDNQSCTDKTASAKGDGKDIDNLKVLFDNVNETTVSCNEKGELENFAACINSEDKDAHYVGYSFKEAVVPQCVQMSQAPCANSHVEIACLLRWNTDANEDNGAWEHVADLTLPVGDGWVHNVVVKPVTEPNPNCTYNDDLKVVVGAKESSSGSKKGLSNTDMAIVIVIVLVAGSAAGFLGMWYWRKKMQKPSGSNDVEMT